VSTSDTTKVCLFPLWKTVFYWITGDSD